MVLLLLVVVVVVVGGLFSATHSLTGTQGEGIQTNSERLLTTDSTDSIDPLILLREREREREEREREL